MTHVRPFYRQAFLTLLLALVLAWVPRVSHAQADDDDDITVVFQTDGTPGAFLTGVTTQLIDDDDTSSGTPVLANAPVGWHFVDWTRDTTTGTVVVSTANPLTVGNNEDDTSATIGDDDNGTTASFVVLDEDTTLTAHFALNQFLLTYIAGAHGSISGATSQTVNFGANGTTVTAVADTGYHFVEWSDGLQTAVRQDTNITTSITVTAEFAINQYLLTYIAGPNGSISGLTSQTVNFGASGTTVTAVADTGYHFVQWSDGLMAAVRRDTNVTTNVTVTAEFAINQYLLTYIAGPNGSISGLTSQTVNFGGSGSQVTAVPDAGFHFVQWSDGLLTATRTDTDVTANLTVTATFAANPALFTLTVTTAGDGTGTVTKFPDETSYSAGTTVTLTATPTNGSTFTAWAGDATGTVSPIVIVMDRSKTVTAIFDEGEGLVVTYQVKYRGCTINTDNALTSGVITVFSPGQEGEGSVIVTKAKVQNTAGLLALDNDHDGDDAPWKTLTFNGPAELAEVLITGSELDLFSTSMPIFLLEAEPTVQVVVGKNAVIENIVCQGRLGSVTMNAVTPGLTTNIVSVSEQKFPLTVKLTGVELTGLRTEQTVKSLSVASKKTKTGMLTGVIGDSANSTATLVLAPTFGPISATAGVHAEIMAGYNYTTTTQTATPLYTGAVKSISAKSKTGTLSGEVFVQTGATVKFKPAAGTANNTMVVFDATTPKP